MKFFGEGNHEKKINDSHESEGIPVKQERRYKLMRGTRATSLVFTLLATFIATNIAIFAANTYFNLDTGEVVVEEVQRVTNVIRATGGMIVGGTAGQNPLAGVALEVAGTQNILFSTSGTIQQTGTGTVSFTGNVGLGTTTPAQRLAVAGTFGIREGGASPTHFTVFQGGDQAGPITYTLPINAGGVNHVLVTDGTGVLRWEAVSGVGAGDITAVGSMLSGDAFAGPAAHNQWLGLGAAAGRIAFFDEALDRVAILGARLDVDNDIHLTGGNRTIAATGTNANLALTGSGTGTVTLASASTGNIQFFGPANTITSLGNLTIAGNFAMSGLTITDGGAVTTIATTGTDELRLDSASGVISIAAGDALRTAGGYTLTSGIILREVHPIFGFDVPVRCSTSCVTPTHQPVSRVVETYAFPAAYAGTTRRHHFTIRYAATAATTWRVWNTTLGVAQAGGGFTLPATAGPLGAGTVSTTADVTIPVNGDDWRLEVTLGTGGQTVQVYEVLLGAYDQIN